jgi:hypothetical protein
MARPRVELQTILETILGSSNVYFQPPTNIHLEYPCIIYRRDAQRVSHADNKPYKWDKRYEVTVIAKDPDSPIPDLISGLRSCSFDRFFTADQLNHDVFTLFF